MSNKRKRSKFDEQSVVTWMQQGESFTVAKERLDAAWRKGTHPSQLAKKAA